MYIAHRDRNICCTNARIYFVLVRLRVVFGRPRISWSSTAAAANNNDLGFWENDDVRSDERKKRSLVACTEGRGLSSLFRALILFRADERRAPALIR